MVDNGGSPSQELRHDDNYISHRDQNPEAQSQQNYQKDEHRRSLSANSYDRKDSSRDKNQGDQNRRGSRSASRSVGQKPVSFSVYVGGISRSVESRDLQDIFQQFLPTNIVMKGRYAFVEFQTEKDADNAIKETNGIKLQGCEILVQQTRTRPGERNERKSGPSDQDECFNCRQRGHWANDCRQRGSDRRYGGNRRRSNSRSMSPRRPRDRRDRSDSRGRDRDGRDGRDDGRSKELREGLCFICKERGHIKSNCPQNRNGDSRGRGGYRGGDSRRRNDSHSRSPPRDYYRRRDYSPPQRRGESPPRRRPQSPPRRRDYSRSRSPVGRKDSRSPQGRGYRNY